MASGPAGGGEVIALGDAAARGSHALELVRVLDAHLAGPAAGLLLPSRSLTRVP